MANHQIPHEQLPFLDVFGAFEISAQPKMQTLPNSVNVLLCLPFLDMALTWRFFSHTIFLSATTVLAVNRG